MWRGAVEVTCYQDSQNKLKVIFQQYVNSFSTVSIKATFCSSMVEERFVFVLQHFGSEIKPQCNEVTLVQICLI